MRNGTFFFEMKRTMRLAGCMAAAAVVMTLAACHHEQVVRTRLTEQEKTTYSKAIAGEYGGSYIILWADESMPWHETEDGRKVRSEHKEIVDAASITVTDNEMMTLVFHKFPVSKLSNVVDDKALAEAADMDLTVRYQWSLHTDQQTPIWGTEGLTVSLTLSYGGQQHHVLFKADNSVRYMLSPEKKESHLGFDDISGIQLAFRSVYIDGQLAQEFDTFKDDTSTFLVVFRLGD